MDIRDIDELDAIMSDEAREQARKDFEKFFPPGTPEIMCTSPDDGQSHLRKVNLEDFD